MRKITIRLALSWYCLDLMQLSSHLRLPHSEPVWKGCHGITKRVNHDCRQILLLHYAVFLGIFFHKVYPTKLRSLMPLEKYITYKHHYFDNLVCCREKRICSKYNQRKRTIQIQSLNRTKPISSKYSVCIYRDILLAALRPFIDNQRFSFS